MVGAPEAAPGGEGNSAARQLGTGGRDAAGGPQRPRGRRGAAACLLPFLPLKDLTLKVLEAVHGMHAKGIIHRDIKLANVLLGDPDAVGEVALSDFGLAIEGAAMTGGRSGTLEYMAPEIGGRRRAPSTTRPSATCGASASSCSGSALGRYPGS